MLPFLVCIAIEIRGNLIMKGGNWSCKTYQMIRINWIGCQEYTHINISIPDMKNIPDNIAELNGGLCMYICNSIIPI
jgi:hypothetical protein